MNLLYIDLFCGAGGTSTGVNSARLGGEECAKVIACVNHNQNAIASHAVGVKRSAPNSKNISRNHPNGRKDIFSESRSDA